MFIPSRINKYSNTPRAPRLQAQPFAPRTITVIPNEKAMMSRVMGVPAPCTVAAPRNCEFLIYQNLRFAEVFFGGENKSIEIRYILFFHDQKMEHILRDSKNHLFVSNFRHVHLFNIWKRGCLAVAPTISNHDTIVSDYFRCLRNAEGFNHFLCIF